MAANSACLYAGGDKAGAAMAAAGVALASVGAGAVVQAVRVAKTAATASGVAKTLKAAGSGAKLMQTPSKVAKIGQAAYNSRFFGKNSTLFGAKSLGAIRNGVPRSGSWNNNNILRIGWGTNKGQKVFRIVLGPSSWQNRKHFDIFTGRFK